MKSFQTLAFIAVGALTVASWGAQTAALADEGRLYTELPRDFAYQESPSAGHVDQTLRAVLIAAMGLRLEPKGFRTILPKGLPAVDAIFVRPGFQSLIFLKFGIEPKNARRNNRAFTLDAGTLYHAKTEGGLAYALYFKNISDSEVGALLQAMNHPALEPNARPGFFSNLFFPQAWGACNVPSATAYDADATGFAAVYRDMASDAFTQNAFQCIAGAVQGAVNATGGAVTSTARLLKNPIQSARGFWRGITQISNVVSNLYHAISAQSEKTYPGLAQVMGKMGWQTGCQVVSMIGTDALLLAFTDGVGAPAVAASVSKAVSMLRKVPRFARALSILAANRRTGASNTGW